MIWNEENFEALLGGTSQSHWPLIVLFAHKELSFEASFEASIPTQAGDEKEGGHHPVQTGHRKIVSHTQYLARGGIYGLAQNLWLLKVFELFLPCFVTTTYFRLILLVTWGQGHQQDRAKVLVLPDI